MNEQGTVTPLEQRYRRALRWYPTAWREANADAIVGTLLDGADGREKPRAGEVANLALNGLFARFGWFEKVLPAGVRDRASGVALGFGFGVTVVMLVMQEWAPWATPYYWYPEPSMVGPFAGWGGVLYSVWALASLAAIAGFGAAARWMLVATIPFSLVLIAIPSDSVWFRPSTLALAVLGSLAFIAALGRPIASVSGRVAALATFLFAVVSVLLPHLRNVELVRRVEPRWMWSDVLSGGGLGGWLIFIMGGLILVALLSRRWSWAGAIIVLSLPWLLISLLSLAKQGDPSLTLLSTAPVVVGLALTMLARLTGYRLALVRRE